MTFWLFAIPSLILVTYQDIERPYALIEENQQMRKASPLARVDAMFEKLQDKLPDQPEFILCVLPERRSSDLYGMLLIFRLASIEFVIVPF